MSCRVAHDTPRLRRAPPPPLPRAAAVVRRRRRGPPADSTCRACAVHSPPRCVHLLSFLAMTTAHRPTWAPAKGHEETGGARFIAPSERRMAKDLRSHTELKFRADGQASTAELAGRCAAPWRSAPASPRRAPQGLEAGAGRARGGGGARARGEGGAERLAAAGAARPPGAPRPGPGSGSAAGGRRRQRRGRRGGGQQRGRRVSNPMPRER